MSKAAKPATSLKPYLLIFGFGVLVFLLIASPLLYNKWKADKEIEEFRYNGFEFTKVEAGNLTLWYTLITVKDQTYRVPFYYHPTEVEDIVLESGLTTPFFYAETQPEVIHITLAPDEDARVAIAATQISSLTGDKYDLLNIETHGALHSQLPDAAFPVITCADADNDTAVFFFQQWEENLIIKDEQHPGCIRFLYTDPEASIRVADRFAYGLLQSMPG